MSLQSFLEKAWQTIKHLFDEMPTDLQTAAKVGVEVVEAIKNFDDKYPEVADALTVVIPGDVDDKIKNWIRAAMPAALVDLRLASWKDGSATPEQVVNEGFAVIQQLSGDIRSAFAHDLAVLIAQEAAKAQAGTLTWSDAVYVIEWYYQHKFKAA